MIELLNWTIKRGNLLAKWKKNDAKIVEWGSWFFSKSLTLRDSKLSQNMVRLDKYVTNPRYLLSTSLTVVKE